MAGSWQVKSVGYAQEITVMRRAGEAAELRIGGATLQATVHRLPDGRFAIDTGQGPRLFHVFADRGEVVVVGGTSQQRFTIEDVRAQWLLAAGVRTGGGGAIHASMPGRVVRVAVQVGDVVADGGIVAVLEAMKMENDVRATHGGIVKRVAVAVGATVEMGAILVELSQVEAEAPAGEPSTATAGATPNGEPAT